MDYAERMYRKSHLMGNLADWMISHGTVLSDRSQSNEYVGIRIVEVLWRGQKWEIIEVDGETCRIDKYN